MEELTAGLTKVGTGVAAVAIVLGLLLLIFFIGARAKGRLQTPMAIVVFLGPAILLLAYGLIVPAFRTTAGSFQDAGGNDWVGLANYGWIFTAPGNSTFLINTVLWLIIAPVLSTALGLTLALLLDRMRRESISKSLIFMPMAISFVGAGIIWGLIYEYRDPSKQQVGLLSQVVMWLGIEDPPNWILWQPFNNFLLMIIMIWIQVGFAMVVLSAAIKAIPSDVVEAAELDGATGYRLFSKVTIPMIRGTLIVVLTTIMIAVLKIFDIVRTMTNGNFGTQVVANEMYAQAFVAFDVGRGSALAVVLFLAVIPLIVYNVVQLRKERTIR
ncbi:MAG: sugar ABC transporter permease [Candidatus Nanopelagicales bacterium]|nr:sugar ABC transporter permease [Candidatus Nanopelagicales bacterium]MCF8558306.1 sugar ABC transporter permease [Candidatus Nanopelagicales bacterium]